ncbi:MAG: transcriptional regulator [Lysobacteraceae bacterium]|nr:MAG: transcriptional regulator [Xanthomonadaceae bacterium]
MTNAPLTGFDWQLLQLLQQDGRASISELAKQLGRSRSTVTEQIQRLRDMGVITGVAATLNEEKLGFGISAFVRLSAGSSRHRQIVSAVCEIPEVAECHVLTGSELLMIRLVAKDMAHLRSLVDTLTQYGSTHTDVIFSTVKSELKIDPSFHSLT